ncbi:MAG: hypothetical protein JST47_12195 [Bacteroidetes bacterium]|nr:hypothetical protein [Bacteroidota bacterium]MBS1973148.1 hypothetical protein [Bacteroidota bacterium]
MRCWLLPILLLPHYFFGQDLNGIWKGTLTQESGGCYPKYFLELQINFSDNNITGKVYDYYDTSKFVKLSFTGKYNPLNHRLVLIENKVLHVQIPEECVPCIKTYSLIYSQKSGKEMLEGDWKGYTIDRRISCPPGKLILQRALYSDFPVDVEQNDKLAEIQKNIRLEKRAIDLKKTIVVDSPKIRLAFYDDATIDNDTITVFVNNKLLLYRQCLTEKPLNIEFNAFAGTQYEVVMYADNLGSIPPNTALMVVTAGSQKFEVYLSSTEQKSAAVRFVYKPK